MNRKAYELANEIKTELLADGDCLMESPDDMEMKRYKTAVLDEIRKERNTRKKTFGRMTVAACAAVAFLTGTVMFGGEVHAAIRQITWSISSALGLSSDLANYRDVINTSVTDKGYVVTLQEAVVADEKLAVNYTIQREDGQQVEQHLAPVEYVYVNGEAALGGAGGSIRFLDEEQTVLGVEMSYEIPGMNPSVENEFRIEIFELGDEYSIKGKWNFAFTATGADLMADTKRIPMGQKFTLPDGVIVTLEELTMNELEQRISFRHSGPMDYLLQVTAQDDTGRRVKFGVRMSDEKSGYMSNEEVLYDSRIADTAGSVTMTLEAVKLPEESGRIPDDYEQIGETFELKLQQ